MDDNLKIPNHIAFIVDGNGRWATERGLSRSKGHEEGFKNIQVLTAYIFKRGIKYISAYLFSTENFKRSEAEVNFLMNLLTDKLKQILDFCHQENIHVYFSGRRDRLSKKVLMTMEKIEEETAKYKDKYFNICFNYGGHAEIIDATKKIVKDVNSGKLDINLLDEKMYEKYLYHELPPVDLLIRTSGEQRISNFMLWQCSYAEFYFPKTYFPDFHEEEFEEALREYTRRDRRFGGIDYDKKNS